MKPPVISDEKIVYEANCSSGIVDTLDRHVIQACRDVAQSQRDADYEYFLSLTPKDLREGIQHEVCLCCVHKPLEIHEGLYHDSPKTYRGTGCYKGFEGKNYCDLAVISATVILSLITLYIEKARDEERERIKSLICENGHLASIPKHGHGFHIQDDLWNQLFHPKPLK